MRWLRGEQEPAAPERPPEQAVTNPTGPALGKKHQMVSEQSPQSVAPANVSSSERVSPWRAKQPSLRPRQPTVAPHLARIGRLEGYKSDNENIYLFFERRVNPPEPYRIRLSKLYMRDACQCSTCVSPTGVKAFATCDITPVPQLNDMDTDSIKITKNGGLEITWKDDFLTRGKHTSVYPLGFLHRLWGQNGRTHIYSEPQRALWDSSSFRAQMDTRSISFAHWMRDGSEFNKAVLDILKYGLVFIRGVPEKPGAVLKIAKRLGPVQSTLFGSAWNVSSETGEEHAAHSSEVPSLHQDLPYWHDIPKLQLLHCVQNDCRGGESLYSDGLRAAWELKKDDPHSFNILCKEELSFHYDHNGRYYTARRSVIKKNKDSSPSDVCWAPPFQGPFPLKRHQQSVAPHTSPLQLLTDAPTETGLSAWSNAARAFKDLLEAPENVLRYRLQPGECVIMDNRRVLNGRTAYHGSREPGGRRFFRGTYISKQTLNGALIELHSKGLL